MGAPGATEKRSHYVAGCTCTQHETPGNSIITLRCALCASSTWRALGLVLVRLVNSTGPCRTLVGGIFQFERQTHRLRWTANTLAADIEGILPVEQRQSISKALSLGSNVRPSVLCCSMNPQGLIYALCSIGIGGCFLWLAWEAVPTKRLDGFAAEEAFSISVAVMVLFVSGVVSCVTGLMMLWRVLLQ